MASSEPAVFLKSVELRLLRCTLSQAQQQPPPPTQPSSSPHSAPPPSGDAFLRPLVENLVVSIERGNYADALSSGDASRRVFPSLESWEFEDSIDCAARFYVEVERSAAAFLRGGDTEAWLQILEAEGDADTEGRCALLLCLGVAALLAFTQQNVTGPMGSFSPCPLQFATTSGKMWDIWARNQVSSVGSDVQGKFTLLQYIVYARALLSMIKDISVEGGKQCCMSIYWWLSRVFLLQQRILNELSSSLYDHLKQTKEKTLIQLGFFKDVSSYWGSLLHEGEAVAIASLAQIEAGILEYTYGRIDTSRLHLTSAEEASGLTLTVTGALGFRTIHQVDAKAQLVLATDTEQLLGVNSQTKFSQNQHDDSGYERKDSSIPGFDDSSNVLMIPRLVENVNDGNTDGDLTRITEDARLTPVQQSVILGQCLLLGRRNRDDELSKWEMAPFIEAIDSQKHSYFTIRSFCDILRIRWESTRSRTKQRALLMMDKLVEVVHEAFPLAANRIQLAYGVYIPTIPMLRKEYSELLVSCGMVGEAVKTIEDLELWDSLIFCYQLLGKKAAAVDLIKERLLDMPNDSRLWCSLGDVTNNDSYFEKALEVSSDRSARAKRSLARNAYNRGDYVTAKDLWESALALNSLYPDGWFALGAAALKARDVDKAIDAFTRAVQLDPDNGEAWNNVACLHMIKKKSKAAFIAFKEALKFKRENWQVWENFSHVAFDIGNIRQALEANKMVLDLSLNKRVDVNLLDNILRKLEDTAQPDVLSNNALNCKNNSTEDLYSNSTDESTDVSGILDPVFIESRETEFLLDMLGNILQQIVRNDGQGDIWGVYARWHKLKGNLVMCCEALLKQVRSLKGQDMWHDRDRLRKFAQASLQLCNVYMEIASSTGSRRELVTAEMYLRNIVKEAEQKCVDNKELLNLKACLDDVKKQLNATSAECA